jgi:hypothetical protein
MDARGAVPLAMIAALLLTSLGGCARYYWSKPGSTEAEFARDSAECAKESAPNPTAAAYGIILNERVYRACLTMRGYIRAKQWEPPPAGSYRGFED